jgi:hypothetical protein
MALRSVCRLFRTLVYEMRFWYTDDVHITALLPGRQDWITTHHNYRFLGKRSTNSTRSTFTGSIICPLSWEKNQLAFQAPPVFASNSRTRTVVRLNATSVILEFPRYPDDTKPSYLPYPGCLVNAAIAMPGSCRNLTSLEINPLHDELSLNLFAIFCPALKRLRIRDTHVQSGNGDLRGNLDGMAGLEEIAVDDFDSDQF